MTRCVTAEPTAVPQRKINARTRRILGFDQLASSSCRIVGRAEVARAMALILRRRQGSPEQRLSAESGHRKPILRSWIVEPWPPVRGGQDLLFPPQRRTCREAEPRITTQRRIVSGRANTENLPKWKPSPYSRSVAGHEHRILPEARLLPLPAKISAIHSVPALPSARMSSQDNVPNAPQFLFCLLPAPQRITDFLTDPVWTRA